MLADSITAEQLNNVYAAISSENSSDVHTLAKTVTRTRFGSRLKVGEVAGIATGIKIGLVLAESEQLEKLLGER